MGTEPSKDTITEKAELVEKILATKQQELRLKEQEILEEERARLIREAEHTLHLESVRLEAEEAKSLENITSKTVVRHYKKWRTGAPPAIAAGYLWKKGGGQSTLGRRNWQRRWFRLEDEFLSYYQEKAGAEKEGTSKVGGLGDPIYSGHLTEAKTDANGVLKAELKLDGKRERYILQVEFKDRVLVLGTNKTTSLQEGAKVLRMWQMALFKHHAYHAGLTQAMHTHATVEEQLSDTRRRLHAESEAHLENTRLRLKQESTDKLEAERVQLDEIDIALVRDMLGEVPEGNDEGLDEDVDGSTFMDEPNPEEITDLGQNTVTVVFAHEGSIGITLRAKETSGGASFIELNDVSQNAQAMGLEHGDILVTVQDQDVRGQKLPVVRNIIASQGRPLKLTVERRVTESQEDEDSDEF